MFCGDLQLGASLKFNWSTAISPKTPFETLVALNFKVIVCPENCIRSIACSVKYLVWLLWYCLLYSPSFTHVAPLLMVPKISKIPELVP